MAFRFNGRQFQSQIRQFCWQFCHWARLQAWLNTVTILFHFIFKTTGVIHTPWLNAFLRSLCTSSAILILETRYKKVTTLNILPNA